MSQANFRLDRVTYGDTATITGGSLKDLRESDRPHAKRGAQILAEALVAEGVEVVFGYPGGANLEIFDALSDYNIEIVRAAFAISGGQRPGPVLIDIPKDIQQHYPRDPEGNYNPLRIPAVIHPPEAEVGGGHSTQLEEVCRLIKEASRPIFYVGGGVVSSNSTGTKPGTLLIGVWRIGLKRC